MGTIPPDAADVDKWMVSSGMARRIISNSFEPGKGFHVKSFAIGYTLNSGAHQFAVLAGDPTSDKTTAEQLHGLVGEFGGLTLRAYEYTEPMPEIPPSQMAANPGIQTRISNAENWCPIS